MASDKRIRIILDSKGAESDAKKLDKAVTGIGAAADKSIFSLNKLAAAVSGAIAVDKIIDYADAFTSIQNQIKRTTTTTIQLADTTAQLLKVSNDTRTGIEQTTELYTSLSISTKSLGKTQEQTIAVTKTINNLFLESGKGASETAGAIKQLGQALQSGTLRGDEFNSVAEGAPGILRALQKETGKSASELRDWAATGAISAKLVYESLENVGQQAQDAADKVKTTFAQSETVAKNNAIAFVGASRDITFAVDATGKSLVKLSENLDLITKAGIAAAAIYVARLIPSIIAYTSAVKTSAVAQLLARDSVVVFGAATATTLAPLTAARVATNALTLSAVGLRGALAFLGGPLGIAFLAATAILYFSSSTEEARIPVDELTKSTEGLTKAQKELTKLKINQEITNQVAVIEDASKKLLFLNNTLEKGSLDSVEGIRAANDEITKQKARLDDAKQSAAKLVDALGKISPENSTAVPTATKSSNKKTSDAKADTQNLQSQLNLQLQLNKIFNDTQIAQDADYYQKKSILLDRSQQEQLAKLDAGYAKENTDRAKKLADTLKTEGVNDVEKKLLQEESQKQSSISTQIYEQEKTNIMRQGVEDRAELNKEELRYRAEAAQEIDSARQITESMKAELAQRSQASRLYVDTELNKYIDYYTKQRAQQSINESIALAQEQQKAQADEQQRQDNFRKAIDNEKLTGDERAALKAEYDNQELLAEQLKQEQLAQIKNEGIKARMDLDKAEYQSRLDNAGALGNALMSLGQGHSKKIFKIGQTLALAQAAVALPSAVLQSFQNGGGYPWGLVPAGAMLATGLKNIQQIKSAGSGLGGGGGGGSASASIGGGAGSSSIPTGTNAVDAIPQQKRIYDLRGVKADDKISVSAMAALLEDDGAIVLIENAREDAARRNVIGVTAR